MSGQIDDESEIRQIQRAVKKMSPEQVNDMMTIIQAAFRNEFGLAGSDVDT